MKELWAERKLDETSRRRTRLPVSNKQLLNWSSDGYSINNNTTYYLPTRKGHLYFNGHTTP